jgi:hypothetical protein
MRYVLIAPNQKPSLGYESLQQTRKTRLFISTSSTIEKCVRLLVGSTENRIDKKVCAPEPVATSPGVSGAWGGVQLFLNEPIVLNRWTPLMVLKPSIKDGKVFVYGGNTNTRTWTALFVLFSDKTDRAYGCSNCVMNYQFLKLKSGASYGVPKLLLEDAGLEGLVGTDFMKFKIPQKVQRIDAAIHRHGQKPLHFQDVANPNANSTLLGAFGVHNLQSSEPSSQRWYIGFGNLHTGDFVNATAVYARVIAPEYAVPDLALDTDLGDNTIPLQLPQTLPLDTWIPVWALPTHKKGNITKNHRGTRTITDITLNPNEWYIAYVRLVSDSEQTVPLKFPRYKTKSWENPRISLLEPIK